MQSTKKKFFLKTLSGERKGKPELKGKKYTYIYMYFRYMYIRKGFLSRICLKKKKKAVVNCWMVTNSLYSNQPAFNLNIVTWVSSGETSRGNTSRFINHTQKSDKLLFYPILSLSEISDKSLLLIPKIWRCSVTWH